MLRGRDVFNQRNVLLEESRLSDVSHWAPNCSSFSRAREKPIEGVLFPPKPLRSEAFPRGIPDVVNGLKSSKRRKLNDDTEMAELSAEQCIIAHKRGRFFSLEHPFNSIARHLTSWRALREEFGVYTTQYHTCMFEGSKRSKNQILIHNVKELDEEIGRLCSSNCRCSRTGLRHLAWRPKVQAGKIISFATGEEREYPEGFCKAYACALQRLRSRENIQSFLEVFSGPNAPLSSSIAKAFNVPLPGSKLDTQKGVVTEFSRPDELPISQVYPTEPIPVETNAYRLAAVEAGKQPSYGKRCPLIPDGLQSPSKHMAHARVLKHPFTGSTSLKKDHLNNITFLEGPGHEVVTWRLLQLQRLKAKVRTLAGKQTQTNKAAAWTAEKLGLKIRTETMSYLQDELNIEDKDVPDICLKGLGILGDASISPFFEPFEVRPTMSQEVFHHTKWQRSLDMMERVKTMGRASPKDMSEAIWRKTLKEVATGTMGPPRLMIHFLDFAPSRRLYLDVTSPVILYTDASDVPERTPRQVLGAVLIDQDTILHTYWPVSPAIISRWIQKKNHMSQLELLAAPLALATWRQRLERRDILLFIDNEGACANLVKGFSPQTDSSAIVGQFWLMACSLELNIYVDRVESKSNPSDGPSRLDCSFLTSIGSRWTNPQADPLENPQIDPAQWFERNQGHRGE